MSPDGGPLDDFGGTARLFPLPNLVLFPAVVQPLHIFEPRYRQMTADALAGDRLLGMALLEPGHEGDEDRDPPICPVVCLGRILNEQCLPDGRYNLLLHGLVRARVLEELPTDRLYRTARVQLLADMPAPPAEEADLRRRLTEEVTRVLAVQPAALAHVRDLLARDLSLGMTCDILAYALNLGVAVKQQLLAEADVGRRVRQLLAHLRPTDAGAAEPIVPARKFPPDFSPN